MSSDSDDFPFHIVQAYIKIIIPASFHELGINSDTVAVFVADVGLGDSSIDDDKIVDGLAFWNGKNLQIRNEIKTNICICHAISMFV